LSCTRVSAVFVGNLAWGTTDEDLKEHFDEQHPTVSATVQVTPSGRSKGWGLLVYDSPESALEAVNTMNDTVLQDRKLTVRLDRK